MRTQTRHNLTHAPRRTGGHVETPAWLSVAAANQNPPGVTLGNGAPRGKSEKVLHGGALSQKEK